jgi:hypothetical protein
MRSTLSRHHERNSFSEKQEPSKAKVFFKSFAERSKKKKDGSQKKSTPRVPAISPKHFETKSPKSVVTTTPKSGVTPKSLITPKSVVIPKASLITPKAREIVLSPATRHKTPINSPSQNNF